jgi:tRNA nucleotidyltransferase/poly(A) polymerase
MMCLTYLDIITKLQSSGFDAYVIGGAVRDMLMNITPKDYDIVTSATPDEIIELFSGQVIKEVGRSFGVVLVDGIEVATYRMDKYFGLNDKNCTVEFASSLAEDVSRRDFTINQMAWDPVTGVIIDHCGGIEDLNNKIIRFIGNPFDRIHEDPNRIIRACRLLAKIDGKFDDETFKWLSKYSSYIEYYVSPERIRLEIIKAMSIPKASRFFTALHDIGGLKHVLPCLEDCYLHPGGPYHIEDIYDHCMMAGDHITTKHPLIKLAGYLHDVGKPVSSRINPRTDDIWFEGHEETGSDVVKRDLGALKFSNDEINLISGLVKNHMRISHTRLTPKGIRRTLRQLEDDGIAYRDLLRVAVSDKMGGLKSQKIYKLRDVYGLLKMFKDVINSKPVSRLSMLAVNGDNVMEATRLGQCKEIGYILNMLMDIVGVDPGLNNKEALINIINDIHKLNKDNKLARTGVR